MQSLRVKHPPDHHRQTQNVVASCFQRLEYFLDEKNYGLYKKLKTEYILQKLYYIIKNIQED